MSELKPCAHCSYDLPRYQQTDEGGHYIQCDNCGMCTKLIFPLMDDVDGLLAEIWNRRAIDRELVSKIVRYCDSALHAGLTVGVDEIVAELEKENGK